MYEIPITDAMPFIDNKSSTHLSESTSNHNLKEAAPQPNENINVISQKYPNSCSSSSSSKVGQRHIKQSPDNLNAFIAVYAYKPQKPDELELKKGSIYYVKERCQDGWFRGINRSQMSGVFPGTYVLPLRNFTCKNVSSTSENNTGTYSKNSDNHSLIYNKNSVHPNPPDLPPRSSGGSSSSMWSSSTVNLIKRITNIKRSKSPPSLSTPTYSMDNPVFEDNSIRTSNTLNDPSSKARNSYQSQPIHVRSGSCPSKLATNLVATSRHVNKMDGFRSHRIKSHKERSSLQCMAAGPAHSSSYHKKSQSLDAATLAFQLSHGSSEMSNASKRKSYTHNEKYKCIVAYPSNSEFELELTVDDIIYVHKKRENGWFKGTHAKTGKVGLFPSSFVEPII